MGKEHLDTGALAQTLVVRHLLGVVIRHRQAQGRVQAIKGG